MCFIPAPSPCYPRAAAGTGSALLLRPSFLSRESLFGVPLCPQLTGMLQAGSGSQAGSVWAAGAQGLSAAEGWKEASPINAITQTCLSRVSCLIAPQEKGNSSGHCFCLSQRYPSASGVLSASTGAPLCPNIGLQVPLRSVIPAGGRGCVPGRDFSWQSPQSSQAAGTASLPGAPGCFCPLLHGKDLLHLGIFPRRCQGFGCFSTGQELGR